MIEVTSSEWDCAIPREAAYAFLYSVDFALYDCAKVKSSATVLPVVGSFVL